MERCFFDCVGCSRVRAEPHDVGEPANERTPNRAVNANVRLWRAGGGREGGVDAAEEVLAKPFALILVPVPRRVRLRIGLRADPQRQAPLQQGETNRGRAVCHTPQTLRLEAN